MEDFKEYNVIFWNHYGNISHYPEWFLNFDHLKEDFEYVLFLKIDTQPDISELVNSLKPLLLNAPKAFIMVTPWKTPPLLKESPDEYIHSFACNFKLFKAMLMAIGKAAFNSNHFLYDLLNYIFTGDSGFDNILARQLPIQRSDVSETNHCDVIIPHKGENASLKNLLFFLKQSHYLNIQVGIDQSITDDIWQLKRDNPKVSFYEFKPNPVGPYIIRNKLIQESKGHLICFQDSDDISCTDRFIRLSDHMQTNNCEFCGSYELRMDNESRTIQAIRYPLDVMNALAMNTGHSLLHPTSMITREAYYKNGTLSEERIFGNDTKFLYHGYFRLKSIQNIPEFLYIRRIHSDSLTTSNETGIGSSLRLHLLKTWVKEFNSVKKGILRLEDTSLTYNDPFIKSVIKKL